MQLKLQSEKILALLLGCAGFFYSLSAQESPIYNFLINLLAGDYFRFKVNSSPLLGRTKFTCYKFKHNNFFNHFQSQCSHYRKIDDSKTLPNCPAIPVTEKKDLVVPEIAIKDGCLVITVTENQSKLWSITLTGGEDLDEVSKDAVFYQLAQRYVWLGTKKEKMDLLIEIENIILPKLNIKSMHRKSLIRKLRAAFT